MLGGPVTAAGEQVAAGPSRGAELARAHRSARQGLAAMLALGRAGQGATTADLGFVGVLLSAGDSGRRFVQDTLGPVLDYDTARGSDLAATLDAWFGEGGHVGRTAAMLHVHPNTVGQRLSRVATLLGEDWSAPDRALQVQLALQLRKLLP